MKTVESAVIGVVGAGAMGRGIAQLFAQAGHRVLLHDAAPGAAIAAQASVAEAIGKLADKGKITREAFDDTLARLQPATYASLCAEPGGVLKSTICGRRQ